VDKRRLTVSSHSREREETVLSSGAAAAIAIAFNSIDRRTNRHSHSPTGATISFVALSNYCTNRRPSSMSLLEFYRFLSLSVANDRT
jgi:hypothetical protein